MKIQLSQQNEPYTLEWKQMGDDFQAKVDGKEITGKLLEWRPPFFEIKIGEQVFKGAFYRGKDFVDVHLLQGNFRFNFQNSSGSRLDSQHQEGELVAPMPGKILKLNVGQGDTVKKGETLLILEAMKMEHQIQSPIDGVVSQILFQEGERVSQGVELVEIEKV